MIFNPLAGTCTFEQLTSPIPENIPQDDIDALSLTPEGRARIAVANHYIGEVWRALTPGGPQNGSEPTQQQTTVGGAGVR